MMDYEVYEGKTTRKWHQLSAEEKYHELEMIGQSRHFKLFSIIYLQRELKEIINSSDSDRNLLAPAKG